MSALSATSLIGVFSGLGVLWLLISYFSPAEYSEIAVVLAYITIFVKLASLGWREKIVSEGLLDGNVGTDFGLCVYWTGFICIMFGATIVVVFIIKEDSRNPSLNWLFAGGVIFFQSVSVFFRGILERERLFGFLSVVTSGRSFINISLLAAVLWSGATPKTWSVLISMLISDILIFLCFFIYVNQNIVQLKFPRVGRSWYDLRRLKGKNQAVTIQQVLTTFIDNIPVIALGGFGDGSFASHYSIFQRINGVISQVLLIPAKIYGFATMAQVQGIAKKRKLFLQIIQWQFILLAPVFLFVILCSEYIISWIAPTEWLGVIVLLEIILIGRIASLFLGPFPEIVYDLEVYKQYTVILLLKLLLLAMLMVVVNQVVASTYAVAVGILCCNLLANVSIGLIIYRRMEFI